MLAGATMDNRRARRIVHVLNRETGECIEIDPKVKRCKNMKRKVAAWSRTCELLYEDYRKVMLTLTCESQERWYSGCIEDYMKKIKAFLGDALISSAWVMEMQERGVVHYHVMLIVKRGTDVPAPDTSGMWTLGSTNRKSWCGLWYLMKYASKGGGPGDAEFPRGAHLFAISLRHLAVLAAISAELLASARWFMTLARLPSWVQAHCHSDNDYLTAHRHKGGGWCVGDAVYKSPWTVTGFSWVTS